MWGYKQRNDRNMIRLSHPQNSGHAKQASQNHLCKKVTTLLKTGLESFIIGFELGNSLIYGMQVANLNWVEHLCIR
jgi:hypothetical protein